MHDTQILHRHTLITHMARHGFALQDTSRISIGSGRTDTPLVHGSMTGRATAPIMQFHPPLETLTNGRPHDTHIIPGLKKIGLNFFAQPDRGHCPWT